MARVEVSVSTFDPLFASPRFVAWIDRQPATRDGLRSEHRPYIMPEELDEIVNLMQEARRLRDEDKPVLADVAFDLWLHNVTEYLLKKFTPELALEWQSLPDSPLIVGSHYHDDPHTWRQFHSMIQQRLKWLGSLPLSRPSNKVDELGPFSNASEFDAELQTRCLPLLAAGPTNPKVWDSAVRTAGVILEERLRSVGQIKDQSIGRDLVNKVFGKGGTLAKEFSGDSERDGWRDLFAGVVGAFRNPSAHRLIDPNPQEGGAFIVFVNLLLTNLGKFNKPSVTTAKDFLATCPPNIATFFRGLLEEAKARNLRIKFARKGFTIRSVGQPCFFYSFPPGANGRSTAIIEIYLKDIGAVDPVRNTDMRVRLLQIAGTTATGDYTIRMPIAEDTLTNAQELWRTSLEFF